MTQESQGIYLNSVITVGPTIGPVGKGPGISIGLTGTIGLPLLPHSSYMPYMLITVYKQAYIQAYNNPLGYNKPLGFTHYLLWEIHSQEMANIV